MSTRAKIILGSLAALFAIGLMCLVVWSRSPKQLTKMCDAGYPDDCRMLGDAYSAGGKVPVDEVKAFAAYKRGCDLGSDLSCSCLGDYYEKGRTVPVDYVKAFDLHTRGCNKHIVNACYGVGVASRDGLGTAVNHQRALEAFEEVCSASHPHGRNEHASPNDFGCPEARSLRTEASAAPKAPQ